MDVFDAIATTRAVRYFTDGVVSDAEVRRCLDAATHAPSGGNIQPWQFLVVREAATRAAIGAVYARAYARYEPALFAALPPFRTPDDEAAFHRSASASRHLAAHLAEASVLVLVLMPAISMTLQDDAGELDVGTPYASVYPAVQNMLLAARALGIGTTLTTVYRIYQQDVRDVCGIPERYEIVALVPFGRPARPFRAGRRRPAQSVTHWETWGAREAAG